MRLRMAMAASRLHVMAIFAVGAALYLPRLGSTGFWDPYEIRVADAARTLIGRGWSLQVAGHPSLPTWLVALGFRAFGVSEQSGRVLIACTAIAALFATYYLGVAIVRPRAALIGTLALATTPYFLLGARQLVTAAPATLGVALGFGGLLHGLGNCGLSRRFIHLGLAALGFVFALGSSGALLSVWPCAAAITGAAFLTRRYLGGSAALVITVGLSVMLALAANHLGYSALLGGIPHEPDRAVVVTTVLKQIGFGFFPWIVLLPLGLPTLLEGTKRPL